LVDSTSADVIALLLLGPLVGERFHCLVTAHPDVAVNQPDREDDAVPAKRSEPRDRVVVIGVDERPVDVQDGYGLRRHAGVCVK
jgi:hypothetical protein